MIHRLIKILRQKTQDLKIAKTNLILVPNQLQRLFAKCFINYRVLHPPAQLAKIVLPGGVMYYYPTQINQCYRSCE